MVAKFDRSSGYDADVDVGVSGGLFSADDEVVKGLELGSCGVCGCEV
jgi:hypothetical protein